MTDAHKPKNDSRPITGNKTVWAVVTVILVSILFWNWNDARPREFAFEEPVGEAESVETELELGVGESSIRAASTPGSLIEAIIVASGSVTLDVDSDEEAKVDLDYDDNWGLWEFGSSDQSWDIGLNAELPTSLNIVTGVGSAVIDLSGINLADLEVEGSAGSFELTLPATENRYTVSINGGIGDKSVIVEDGAALEFTLGGGVGSTVLTLGDSVDAQINIDGGVGDITLEIPASAAVQVEHDGGVGELTVPNSYQRLDDDRYQTPNFEAADVKIRIEVDGGVGDITIRTADR